nr:NACHT, LRR and PYD domains-containing protein 12-like [Nerophis lumbriciformis]
MALANEQKELLFKMLEDMGEDDFNRFKFFTHLPESVPENAKREKIASELVRKHGENALNEAIKILEKIGNKNLAERLRRNILEMKGAVFSVHDDDQIASSKWSRKIAKMKRDLQDNLRTLYSFVPEGNTERWKQQPLVDVYTELDVTYGSDVMPDKTHEVLQMETCIVAKKSILPCDIFKSADGKQRPIRTLLTVGFAGIGKTFLVQKFVRDWANGITNQDLHFIFPLTFRELNKDKGKSFTLAQLVQRNVCESKHMTEETLSSIFSGFSEIKILFVLDGLDECNFEMDFKNETKVDINVKDAYPLEVLLAHLVRGNLLTCARVWITTRPATARDIPSDLIDSRTKVRGFSDFRRLEYFRKRFPNRERIIEHIRKSRTIFFMCHMPIFCWLIATVLQDHLDKGMEGELPTTLTDIYTEYAFNHLENSNERQTTKYIHYVKALAKLAFHHTMNRRQIFYEKDLFDCGFDYGQAAKHCGLFSVVFKEVLPLRRNQQGKMFQFVHLTIQEYLAALYVVMSLFHDNKNVLAESELAQGCVSIPIIQVHKSALQKASESEGYLDLFLRFLFGLSLHCNQELVGELLKAPKDSEQSKSDTVELIKERIKQNTPEKNINLFYCLNELNDHSLLKYLQQERNSGRLSWSEMPNDMWSALAFFLLTSDEAMNSFNLQEYSGSALGLEMLLSVVKASQKSVLHGCNLDKRSCHLLASVLSSPSNLRHLHLSLNSLSDDGVDILSKGLASPHCILEVLKLSLCKITEKGCNSLAKALELNLSHLQELDLWGNNLLDGGVEILSEGLASPHCILKVLNLRSCKITAKGCVSLAKVLKLNPSHLHELHLSDNSLSDEGVEILLKGLASPHCNLKVLDLHDCKITKQGCVSLAETLKLKPSHLQELDLSANNLSDEGLENLSKGLASPDCVLQVLRLSSCKITKRGCDSLAEALKLNPTHLQELQLNFNDLSDEGVESLSKGLANPDCNLKVLRLVKCKIKKGGCVSLAEALKLNPSHLQELDLNINSLSDEGVKILLEGLVSPYCNLKVLGLVNCGIKKQGCVALASALKFKLSHLQELFLSKNTLSDECVEILSKGLASPPCNLKVLE